MDYNQRAKHVVDVATGQASDTQEAPQTPRKVSSKARGGQARAGRLSAERRSEIAQKAAQARWNKPTAA